MAFIEEEMVAAVGITAAALSPKARRIARKGAVYGLAGVLKAGDVVASAARGAARGAQDGLQGHPSTARSDGGRTAGATPRTATRRATGARGTRGSAPKASSG